MILAGCIGTSDEMRPTVDESAAAEPDLPDRSGPEPERPIAPVDHKANTYCVFEHEAHYVVAVQSQPAEERCRPVWLDFPVEGYIAATSDAPSEGPMPWVVDLVDVTIIGARPGFLTTSPIHIATRDIEIGEITTRLLFIDHATCMTNPCAVQISNGTHESTVTIQPFTPGGNTSTAYTQAP